MEEILKQILDTIKQKKTEKATLTILEASEYSGIGQAKIRELIDKQNTDFPFFKVGVRALINRDLLDAWLENISKEHRDI